LKNRNIHHWSLSKTNFEVAPDLTRCSVPEDTSFTDAVYGETSTEATAKYIILQRLAKSINDREGSEWFRARILACNRANGNTPTLGRMVLAMYEISSKYGTNYTRPLLILAAVTVVSFMLYLGWWSAVSWTMPSQETITRAGRFTLRQVFKPFDALSENLSATPKGFFDAPSLFLSCVATVQSLVSLSLAGVFLHTFYRVFSRE
jgi:hypothetical protein